MHYQRNKNVIALRLSIGEDIVESIISLCKKEKIKYAQVNGLGAVNDVTVGFYNTDDKKYYPKTFKKQMEMVSLIGNVTMNNNEEYLHLHASFSDENCNVFGGHLNKAIVSVTAEIFINVIDGEMNRRVHPVTGLNIFDI